MRTSQSAYLLSKLDEVLLNCEAELEAEGSSRFELAVSTVPESPPLSSVCQMCGKLYHRIQDCLETWFLMSLGICAMDETEQVVMIDESALPQAEGEGGIA